MENTGTPLKRGKNTFTVQLHYIYSIIALHLQHYCITFTALLQHISTPAQLQHISAQLKHISAHLQHILVYHITSSSV